MESGLWVQQIVIVLAPALQLSREQLWNWKLGRTHNYPALPPVESGARSYSPISRAIYILAPNSALIIRMQEIEIKIGIEMHQRRGEIGIYAAHIPANYEPRAHWKKPNKQFLATDTIGCVSNGFISKFDKLAPTWNLLWVNIKLDDELPKCSSDLLSKIDSGKLLSKLLSAPSTA